MTKVHTAGGEIEISALGRTLMHEHIFVFSNESNQNYPETWGDEDAGNHDAVRKLRNLKSGGIDSIVDMTVLGLGRNVPRIRRIAAQVDLNILVATGIYICNDPTLYSRSGISGDGTDPSETLTEMFVRDIQEGIADTGVRAAILKCATDVQGITPAAEQSLRAVARAHRITGTSRFQRIPTPGPGEVSSSSVFSKRKVSICPG